MPPAGFAPAIPANEGLQAYALARLLESTFEPHKFLKIHIFSCTKR